MRSTLHGLHSPKTRSLLQLIPEPVCLAFHLLCRATASVFFCVRSERAALSILHSFQVATQAQPKCFEVGIDCVVGGDVALFAWKNVDMEVRDRLALDEQP